MKKNITFDDYKNCVLNDTPKRVKINAITTLKLTNYSLTQDKLALSNKDDKEFGLINPLQEHTDTFAVYANMYPPPHMTCILLI